MTAAFAALITATTPLAYAQTLAPSQTTPRTDRSTPSAYTTGSGELRASQVIGSTVYDVQNRNIGSVKDIVLDRDGRITAIVVDVGAFLGVGGKYVAVSLNDIKTDNDRLTLNRSKEQLQAAQSYQLGHQQ
jgi:sporulation protein YlmC with PRC-barrel domain